jgi:hypothetical protein
VTDTIQFSAWAVQSKVPDTCPLCQTEHPLFRYTVSTDPLASGEPRSLCGFCCLRCAQQLLASMAELTLSEWARQIAQQPEPGEPEGSS